MGHPDFRANGRIFATLHHDRQFGMVKLPPDEQQRFIASHPAAFAPESGAWGRSGCTRVRLDAVDEDTLGDAITLAWQNISAARGASAPRRRTSVPARARSGRKR